MANQLKMAEVQTILTLHKSGYSNRKIAELTGVHRETVARYVNLEQSENRPNAPTGSAEDNHPPTSPASGPASACEPHREVIEAKLEQGLSAQRIWQDLSTEHEFTGSYYSVRRFAKRLREKHELPFRRIEVDPGEEAQVDFGTGAPIVTADGKRRRPWVFRFILSHSRKGYSESIYRQTTDNFIACLENAFHYFGGVPKRVVIDNLKAAVPQADWYDPIINPKLQSFAAHYGTAILPTKPYTPRHKGKVESGVKYVKNNGLKGRTFSSLEEQNEFLLNWEQSTADTRIHGTTKKQVGKLFDDIEQSALLPLPKDRFPLFQEARRTVYRDGHVEVAKAFYSVPPEYVGRRLWVRWDSRLVRVFNDRWEQVAVHAKSEPGRLRTAQEHIPTEKVSAVERGTDALLRQTASIGPHTKAWSEAMTQSRGVEAVRVLVGLKSLAGKHSTDALESACEVALLHGVFRLKPLRQLLKRSSKSKQQQFDFIEQHPIIRPLSDYSLNSLHEFRKERTPHGQCNVI